MSPACNAFDLIFLKMPVYAENAQRLFLLTCKLCNAFVPSSFIYPDCSGTASQATPQGRRRENATAGKVGFELATDGIQFYVFANLAGHLTLLRESFADLEQ